MVESQRRSLSPGLRRGEKETEEKKLRACHREREREVENGQGRRDISGVKPMVVDWGMWGSQWVNWSGGS